MATFDEICVGLKGRLGTIAGLTGYAIEPASPKYPAAWPFLAEPAADYDQTHDGGMTWHFRLTVALAASEQGHAQTNLMPYLAPTGAKSIKAAIEGDPTLGGLAGVYAVVLRVQQVGPLPIAGGLGVGAVFAVDVLS